jgi:hypothetical protein
MKLFELIPEIRETLCKLKHKNKVFVTFQELYYQIYRMLSAEEAVLVREGSVVRLAGLYHEKRGPHTFWLQNGTIQGSPDVCINMLHYEDAAVVSIAALEKGIYYVNTLK